MVSECLCSTREHSPADAFVRDGSSAVVPAEGTILEHILEAEHQTNRSAGLSWHAYLPFETAQMKTPWGRAYRRRFALVGRRAAPLASATRYSFAGVLDRQPIRVCAVGDVLAHPQFGVDREAGELVERLFDAVPGQDSLEPIRMTDVTLSIAPSARHERRWRSFAGASRGTRRRLSRWAGFAPPHSVFISISVRRMRHRPQSQGLWGCSCHDPRPLPAGELFYSAHQDHASASSHRVPGVQSETARIPG
jgi:hypothetical protein